MSQYSTCLDHKRVVEETGLEYFHYLALRGVSYIEPMQMRRLWTVLCANWVLCPVGVLETVYTIVQHERCLLFLHHRH